jgi:drug/metabolite transporter (DMT)-like permease
MVVWSTWGVFVRWLPVPAWSITFYVGGVACVFAAALWYRSGRVLAGLWSGSHLLPLALMGLVFLANNVLFLTAYERTTIANAVITHYTAPIFVALLAPITLRERLLPSTPWALLLGCVGLVLIVPGIEWSFADRHVQGLLLGTLSGLAYGCLILMARHFSLRVSALRLIFVQNLVIAVVLLPFVLVAGPAGEPRVWAVMILLGLVHATGGGLVYLAGIRKLRAQTAAILGYLEPLFAVACGVLFFGEVPSGLALVGGLLVLLGGFWVVWDEGRRQMPVDAGASAR